MQTEIQFSLLVWEDIFNLPFPDEMKPVIAAINWSEFEWHASGLPHPFAKFSMVGGKNLYLSNLPDGEVKVSQMADFTGDIVMAGFFVNELADGEYNYFVNFLVTILKGSVVDVKLHELQKQPVQEYKEALVDFNAHIKRVVTISNSWWFRWIYRPWFFTVRGIGYACLFVLKFIKDVVVWIVSHLTPL